MQLLESLQTGRFGVTVRMPPGCSVRCDEYDFAELLDERTQTVWFFFFFPRLSLDLGPQHQADLRRSMEYYARPMFDGLYYERNPKDDVHRPRTADPTWSPMIDVEQVRLGGAYALRMVHRMAYEPCRELIMGHLLLPLQQGLFEARVLCADETTGLRESLLVAQKMRELETTDDQVVEAMTNARQADFDDRQYDAMFPGHVLTRTRAALRWFADEANLLVTEAPAPHTRGEVELLHLDCALVAPPRFVYEATTASPNAATFRRVSFCGTDGVETFVVTRWDKVAFDGAKNLLEAAELIARRLHQASGVQDVELTVESLSDTGKLLQALVVVEGRGRQGAQRNAMLFLRDQHRRTWSLNRFGAASIPRPALVSELCESARTFRVVRPPRWRDRWSWPF